MQVRSLGQEDPLEEEVATHSSALAWEVSWTEEPGVTQFMGSQRVGHNSATKQQQTRFPWTPVVHHGWDHMSSSRLGYFPWIPGLGNGLRSPSPNSSPKT